MKKNYTITFTVDHESDNLVETVGIPDTENPIALYNGIITELKNEAGLSEGAPASATSSHVLFDLLPKITEIPESYMAFFMVLGYHTWLDMVRDSFAEAKQSG